MELTRMTLKPVSPTFFSFPSRCCHLWDVMNRWERFITAYIFHSFKTPWLLQLLLHMHDILYVPHFSRLSQTFRQTHAD